MATREVRPVGDLIRFVVGPDGEAVPDVKSKLPGRGVWVTATQEALGDAIKRKAFARGFKRDVRLPADLVGRTEQLLERAALDALAIAGKAGLVATGSPKPRRRLAHERRGRPVACGRSCARGRPQSSMRRMRRAASGTRPAAVIGILDLGAIGFGIGPPKCDTCSPARRACERHLFGALAAPGTVSDRRSDNNQAGTGGAELDAGHEDMDAYDRDDQK